jgi:F-box/leucine-rich repeat protein 2/20
MTVSAGAHARIANHWTRLTALRVRFQSSDNKNAESSACDAGGGLIAVCENCQALVELTLYDRAPASVVTAVLQVCSPNLQKITIPALLRAGDYEIIASRCSQLRELYIDSGTVDDAALLALAAGCPKLTYVPLCQSKVSDVGIIAVVARNRVLTSLNLTFNCNVTDAGIEAVTANCALLECIHLASCKQLTDATLVAIGQHCHNLRELNINDTSFTHVGLEAVTRGCPLLENLSASGGSKLGFATVARCCPRLRCLAAANADVPTEAVLALAECCPLLEKVILSHNPQIGDEAITALARGCPNLTELGITRTSVTAQGMCAIREHCKSLRHIFL